MMTILCCGDRNWSDKERIREVLGEFVRHLPLIVEGGCRGADRMAGEVAKEFHLPLRVYDANWELYGDDAGPLRNQEMLDAEKPDLVIAFHPDLKKSRGTADMVRRAKAANVSVLHVSEFGHQYLYKGLPSLSVYMPEYAGKTE